MPPSAGATADAAALHLAAIVAYSDDAIVSKDTHGTILSWNLAAERMFGYAADEVIGKSIRILIPHERLAEEDEVLRRICRGESVDHFETVRVRKDGTQIDISLTVSPIRAPDGTIVGASKIARDITERKRMEAALMQAETDHREMQRRLLALVAGSAALLGSPRLDDVLPAILGLARGVISADAYAVWRFNAGRGVWQVAAASGVSAAFTASIIEGFADAAITALPFNQPLVVTDVTAERVLTGRQQAYAAEGIVSMVAFPLTITGVMSGTLVAYYRSTHRFSDLELHVGRAFANLTAAAIATAELYDEQRRSREAAERENEQSRFLADAGAALSSSLDHEQTLRTIANLAVPRIADWCAVDVVDTRGAIRRLAVAHVDREKIEAVRLLQERYPERGDRPGSVAHVIRTGQPTMLSEISDEMLVDVAKDDEHLAALRGLRLVSYACVPMVAHGRTLGALTFATAESGRELTEADFRFLQDVAYRAALAVDNARAYDQVRAANASKDQFLAMVSHDLRTPVNAVLGWTRLLETGAVPREGEAHALEVIERSARAQLRLIEDLLDMSRIVAGKFRVDKQPMEVSALARTVADSVRPLAAAKAIALEVTVDPRAGMFVGDPARLEQAVSNLLSNAVKFTAKGGRVGLRIEQLDALLVIEVRDTGEGIAPEELEHIFDRFWQGGSGAAASHNGLGLGLAIVRHIVEMHGGRVSVASAGKGTGATFRMELPVVPESDAALVATGGREADVADTARFSPLAPLPDVLLNDISVLVVDDNREALDLLESVLKSRGASVWCAHSAAEGLVRLDERVPDVIISDIAMPNQDGFAFISAVRARPRERGGRVPAIALTAYVRPEDRAQSLRSGFQIHLAKPVDLHELLVAVGALGRAHTRSGQPL